MKPLYGVFGAVGTWPDWLHFFDLSRSGVVRSFLVLLICFPSLWLVMVALETRRAELAGTPVPEFDPVTFVLIIGLWLASFPITSGLTAMMLGKAEMLARWWVVRNWALACMALALGVVFAFVRLSALPTIVGYGVLLAAYLGLLPIDIRLAQRAGGFTLPTAVLIGCIIVSTGMMVLLTGLLQVIQ